MPNPLLVLCGLAGGLLLVSAGLHYARGAVLAGTADLLVLFTLLALARALVKAGRLPLTLIIPRMSPPGGNI